MTTGYMPERRSPAGVDVLGNAVVSDAVSGWEDRLRLTEEQLDMIINQTEEEFLSIGSALRDFHGRAGKISEMASAVATRMTGGSIVGAIDHLNGLLERMELHLQRSEAETMLRKTKLGEILDLIEGVSEPLEEFYKITRAMRALEITARVQNAPLLMRNGSLKILLDDVRKLSHIIADKLARIQKDLRSLQRIMAETLSRFRGFEENHQHKTRTIIESTMTVLCSLTEQYGLSTARAQDVVARSGKITASAREIVTSVQFHDITRQQFGRAKKALNNVRAGLSVFVGEESLSPVGEIVTGLGRPCAHHVLHLAEVRDSFVDAVQGIVGNLKDIASNVVDISADARKMVGRDGTGKSAFLVEMEGMLSSVTATFTALSASAAAGGELSDAMQPLTRSMADLTKFMVDIEEIAEDIELIALNTQIKSAETGDEGCAFEVVADTVQRLSSRTCRQAETVSGILKAVGSAAEELSLGDGSGREHSLKEVRDISADLESLIMTLSGLNREIGSLFIRIEESGSDLSHDIGKVADGIRVHGFVAGVVDEIVSGLNETVSDVRRIFPEDDFYGLYRSETGSVQVGEALGRAVKREDLEGHLNIEFF
jgi:methyl-accepting chemotaxis protein